MTCDHIRCRGIACANEYCLCRCHGYEMATVLGPCANTSRRPSALWAFTKTVLLYVVYIFTGLIFAVALISASLVALVWLAIGGAFLGLWTLLARKQ